MPRISQDSLQKILDLVNIRQLIEEYVPLKKRGNNWSGLCPFHADKDPSFTVSEDKQFFHCFGCGQSGNVFSFLMKMKGLSFMEAAQELSERTGVKLDFAGKGQGGDWRDEHRDILEANLAAEGFFRDNLTKNRAAEYARQYLLRRGVDQAILSRFNLGYAPQSWDSLLSYLHSKGFSNLSMAKAGLIVERDDKTGFYDRFRDRVIFPVRDRRGDLVAFGGRALGDGNPKYLNSPESPVYSKSKVLYGFYENKSTIRKALRGFVVEGYMDLISLNQFGVNEVVATLGTALTIEHAKQMRSLCQDWVMVFDGDEAGQNAAMKSLPILYGADIRPKVMTLPSEHDPDSFIRKEGKDTWEELARNAPAGLDFVVKRLLEVYGSTPDGIERASASCVVILKNIPDPIKKSIYVTHVAQLLGIREDTIWQTVERGSFASQKQKTDVQPAKAVPAKNSAEENAEAMFLGFLINYPQFISFFIEQGTDLWLETESFKTIWFVLKSLALSNPQLTTGEVLDNLNVSGLQETAKLLLDKSPPCEDSKLMLSEFSSYSEKRKKKALFRLLTQELEQTEGDEEKIEILKRLQEIGRQ